MSTFETADKMHDPKGGLSAEGRKKFNSQGSNLKPGVKGYTGASEADKKRWVRWALRFAKTPRPLKKPNGDPTPYAKMFAAWGRPVPTSAADVRATYNLALTRKKSLGMGDAASFDLAEQLYPCPDPDCARDFVSDTAAFDHAEIVHTFDETKQLVASALNAKFGRESDWNAVPSVPGIYVYIENITADWVVYRVSGDGYGYSHPSQQATYSINGTSVTLGEPTPVVARTVYDGIAEEDN